MSCCRFLTLPTLTPLPSLSSYRVTRGPTTALTTLASTPRSASAFVRRSLVPSASCSGTPLPRSRMPHGGGVSPPAARRRPAPARCRRRARPAEAEAADRRRRVPAGLHGPPRLQRQARGALRQNHLKLPGRLVFL